MAPQKPLLMVLVRSQKGFCMEPKIPRSITVHLKSRSWTLATPGSEAKATFKIGTEFRSRVTTPGEVIGVYDFNNQDHRDNAGTHILKIMGKDN